MVAEEVMVLKVESFRVILSMPSIEIINLETTPILFTLDHIFILFFSFSFLICNIQTFILNYMHASHFSIMVRQIVLVEINPRKLEINIQFFFKKTLYTKANQLELFNSIC